MKRLGSILAVAIAAIFFITASPANAMDTSIGAHGGIANPNVSCNECEGSLSAHQQKSYGAELRTFYTITGPFAVGAEVAYDYAGYGDVRSEGTQVASIRDRVWSFMPMVRLGSGGRAYLFAGIGVAQPRFKIMSTESGESVSATDRVALISKVGVEYLITRQVGVYAQWQYLNSGPRIDDTDFDFAQQAGQMGLTYHF